MLGGGKQGGKKGSTCGNGWEDGGIRILSQFHLATPIVYIQNLNCPKNAKNACADKIFGMIFHTMYDTCEMLNLSSQQEISYILLSVTNNIHLYHLPTSC